jgi:hypothetical protein
MVCGCRSFEFVPVFKNIMLSFAGLRCVKLERNALLALLEDR